MAAKSNMFLTLFSSLVLLVTQAQAVLNATETSEAIVLSNDRLYASVNKSFGAIDQLFLDNQNLLGEAAYVPNTAGGSSGNGVSGVGPYLDCYCILNGTYTPGYIAPEYKLFKGKDSEGIPYGGAVMGETYPNSGLRLEQYWFLREGETGIHTFSRILFHNATNPFWRNLQEYRTLFRPNSTLWTHLLSNPKNYAALPSTNVIASDITVQDATWYLGNEKDNPYTEEYADYFTKYTFSEVLSTQRP